ncbi:DUF4838 domain-containing protein [Paenibacillus sp. GCM10027626]|uniref:DUF4838 domain-containing protein n=1 Tax=Paenibacillus sp. GCM10027626 TaxID=3273411 RepID=UPI00363EE688
MKPISKFKQSLLILLMLSIAFSFHAAAAGETLPLNGKAQPSSPETQSGPYLLLDNQTTIVISASATNLEKQAAEELQTYILKMSGLELSVTDEVYGVDGKKLFIGSAAPNPELDRISAGGEQPESFRLHVTEESAQFVGLTDQGTLYAVYELLEQLGVRWFMPGELGTVVPALNSVKLRLQDTIQHPGYVTRILAVTDNYPRHATIPLVYNPTEGADWYRYTRQGGDNFGKHGLPCTYKNTDRPDLYMKEKGVTTIQFDVTNPEVLACVVEGSLKQLRENPTLKYISMGPNDGHGFGETEWDADDFDPMNGKISVTDRYVKFYNMVLAEVNKEFPDVGIAFYAYSLDYRPPVREIPDPKLMPILAPIAFDRIHSIDNPLTWERQYLKDIIEGWEALGVNEIMYRGYLYNLAEPGLPFSITSQIKSEFAYFKQKGIERIRVETAPAWGYHGPGLYLAAKMMWDPTLDAEAVLADYFEKFYGPAAEDMRKHFTLLEKAYDEADYFAGSAIDTPHILTDKVMRELEKSLKKAETRTKGPLVDSVYSQRVAMIRTAFDFGDHFLNMLEANNKHDFVKAKEHLDRVNELSLEAISHSPVILNPFAQYYIKRFWGTRIVEGYNRVTDGNQIVAKMPDEWSVMLFPNSSGAEMGLWKPELGTESWMKLKTYSESWSDQGLRYYMGHAWYRTTVDVSKKFNRGNPIRLWFSSIDESARVWMNGTELPLLKKGSFAIPWEFDATQAVKFDQPNVIVVDVGNKVLDELGSGGIVGPVMLWEVITEPDTVAPTVPLNLSGVAVSGSEISLSWSASTDNVGVAGYEIYRNSILIGRVDTNSFTDINLNMGTTYKYTVRAFDKNMNLSANSGTVSVLTKIEN